MLVLLIRNSKVQAYDTKRGVSILNDTYADDLTVNLKYKRCDKHSNTENVNALGKLFFNVPSMAEMIEKGF